MYTHWAYWYLLYVHLIAEDQHVLPPNANLIQTAEETSTNQYLNLFYMLS